MKLTTKLLCVSTLAALAACAPAEGYYDSRGNYQYSGSPYAANSNRDDNFYVDNSARRGDTAKVAGYDRNLDPEMRAYTRAGFYDYEGTYIPYKQGPVISRSYIPAKGKCRVWFPDRPAVDQPPVESCVGIQYRVPSNAYVIFGG